MKLTHLSHGIYAISDRNAGILAKQTTRKKLPRHGYEVDVTLPDGRMVTLARRKLCMGDPIKRKRGWVWGVIIIPELPAWLKAA